MMPVLCATISAFMRSSFCAALSTAVMPSERFGRENPLTCSNGERRPNTLVMSSRTIGVAVAVNATHCGRPSFSKDRPSRR